ncbi:MAG: hypothetical protein ACLGPM_07640 [Acidobacteriota bacterium]
MNLISCAATIMIFAVSALPVFAALVAVLMTGAIILHRQRPRSTPGVFVGRHRTRDISYPAQSPTTFIGRVTRSTPAPRITPDPNDATNPVAYYGLAALATSTNTLRSILATDAGTSGIAGVAVQPFPTQASSGTNYGAQAIAALTAIPAGEMLNTLRTGFVGVYCNTAQVGAVTKADKVFVWCAASTGTHIQGGFENAAVAAITATAKVGNTGNGTVTAGPTVTAGTALNGDYVVNFTDATHFEVFDPNGKQLEPGVTGTAYLDGGIGFTITAGGTAFAAGDQFTMAVAYSTIPVPNAYFNGPGDSATGAVELAFNL